MVVFDEIRESSKHAIEAEARFQASGYNLARARKPVTIKVSLPLQLNDEPCNEYLGRLQLLIEVVPGD